MHPPHLCPYSTAAAAAAAQQQHRTWGSVCCRVRSSQAPAIKQEKSINYTRPGRDDAIHVHTLTCWAVTRGPGKIGAGAELLVTLLLMVMDLWVPRCKAPVLASINGRRKRKAVLMVKIRCCCARERRRGSRTVKARRIAHGRQRKPTPTCRGAPRGCWFCLVYVPSRLEKAERFIDDKVIFFVFGFSSHQTLATLGEREKREGQGRGEL